MTPLKVTYFDYPLEQGLRRIAHDNRIIHGMYFDYPLEQGLRQFYFYRNGPVNRYFDYPLEQGLRLVRLIMHQLISCILIIH